MSSPDTIALEDAQDPLVLALDTGSSATRGGIYDALGRSVKSRRTKVEHTFVSKTDGTSEVDPDQIVANMRRILGELATADVAGRLRGVALDTFASSLVGVGPDGAAVTPCYTYADGRSYRHAEQLRAQLDEAEVQERTGTRLHASYHPARFLWLRDEYPDLFSAATRWMTLGEYAYLQLIGTTAVGTAAAAWNGLIDRRTGEWDQPMVEVSGIDLDALSEIRDPDRPLTDYDTSLLGDLPGLEGTVWYPVIGDGLGANIGSGAGDGGTFGLSTATSGAVRVLAPTIPDRLPSGLWCYRVDAKRSLIGGALNDVGRVYAWLEETVRLPEDTTAGQVLAAPVDEGTPLFLPFLTGERSTGWRGGAQAVYTGITAANHGASLYRGAFEGVALAYRRIADQLRDVAGEPERIVVSGNVTRSTPEFMQLLADALGTEAVHITQKRSTMRGTALLALETLAPGVDRVPPKAGDTIAPRPEHAQHYADRLGQFDAAYEKLYGEI